MPVGDAGSLRVAVVGCGRVVEEGHGPALAASPRFEIAAIVDPSSRRRDLIGAQLGVPASSRHAAVDTLHHDRVDAALITTPPHARRAVVEALAPAGVGIVSEKPLATTLADVDRIAATVERSRVGLAMLHNYPHMPEFRRIGQAVEAGELGELHTMIFRALGSGGWDGAPEYHPRWRDDISLSGGGRLVDMGIHGLCLAGRFARDPCTAASAQIARRAGETEKRCFATFRYGDVIVSCEIGAGLGSGGVEVIGTEAKLELTYPLDLGSFAASPARLARRHRAGASEIVELPPRTQFPASMYEAAWHTLREGRSDAPEAHATLAAAHAAYLSAHDRRVVELPLDPAIPIYRDGVSAIWN